VEFSYPLSWWQWAFIVAGVVAVACATYLRLAYPLAPARRLALTALRALTLLLLVAFLFRPVRLVPPSSPENAVVPVLVDDSRSMALADVRGQRRIDQAETILRGLTAELGREFAVEVLTFGEGLRPRVDVPLSAAGRRSDLVEALQDARKRYEGRTVAGMVVISDGGDTSTADPSELGGGRTPVYAIGVGSSRIARDREVLSVTAGEAPLEGSVVDLNVSAVSHGYAGTPLEIRVLANGRPIEVRRVTPPVDGSPVHEVFQVSPDRASSTLYTVEIPPTADELASGNNQRAVLVPPPGRKRRLLLAEGAPGFEHSFLKRAWAEDAGFEVDSVVRKGKNDQGVSTFLVQGEPGRSAALVTGFPTTREALFAYDAVVLANTEADLLSQEQLAMISAFVSERGGGLLALGARTFQSRALVGTPLEELLPLELNDRSPGILLTSSAPSAEVPNKVRLTGDGAAHPMMRIVLDPAENARRWAALPALAASTPLGGARPGAQVLAVADVPGSGPRPIVAVQRYGRGRSMLFAGEASWRWRMMMPASDRSYETFWRQAARWMSTTAPDPVSLVVPETAVPGETVALELVVRDRAFAPVPDADTVVRVVAPDGSTRELRPVLADPATGRHSTSFAAEKGGVYKVSAEAIVGGRTLAAPVGWFLVGGADRELTDPRLNEEALRRVADVTGGRYLDEGAAAEVASLLRGRRGEATLERREMWHTPWAIGLIVLLLSAEWMLRRRWGLR
jgi:uncharacterized membrane protein